MPGRYIKGNKGTEAPSNLIITQTLSLPDYKKSTPIATSHKLRCFSVRRVRLEGNTTTRVATATGTTQDEFWQFLDRYSDAQRRTWIFGEDIGKQLKLLGFLKRLDAEEFTLKPLFRTDRQGNPSAQRSWSGKFVIDQRVTFIQCRKDSRKYVFVDVNNYWQCGIDAVCESLGVHCGPTPTRPDDDGHCQEWCKNRTDAIANAVVSLITEWTRENCGVFQVTAAGLSFTHWRHTCELRVPRKDAVDVVCEPDAEHHDMERDAYFGGRVQPYTVGEVSGPLYHVDVNSLYPHVMREHSFPRRFIRRVYHPDPARVLDAIRVYGCVADVLIRTRSETYPVRIDGRQFHCNGCYWATLCGPELERALQSGVVDKVGRAQYYSVAPLFRGWVDYWYRRKLAAIRKGSAGRGELSFVKAILLSLSGKYAQKGRRWLDSPGVVALERWGGWSELLPGAGSDVGIHPRVQPTRERDDASSARIVRQWRGIAGHAQYLDGSHEPGHAFPLISAYITAHGREYMRSLIVIAGEDNVHYMATDSLIVTQRGYSRLKKSGMLSDDEIGKLKTKGRHDRGEIFGANHYEMDGELTAAGWLTLTKTDARGNEVCEVWDRGVSIIATGPTDNVTVRTLPVGRYDPDFKGTVDQGNRWRPYRLSFDPEFTDKPPRPWYSRSDLTRLTS